MPNHLRIVPKPILKQRSNTQLSILPNPQPPTVHRPPTDINRDESTLPEIRRRVKTSLREAIDYDKFTPTQQAQLDAGCFGSIELKQIRPGEFYYYMRWQDPANGKKRSTYLAKDWDKAIAKRKLLINGSV